MRLRTSRPSPSPPSLDSSAQLSPRTRRRGETLSMDYGISDRRSMMAIPITYNVRNLRLRLSATMMTALGIALTVAVAVFIMALLAGLKKAFVSSGDPLNVLVLRKGSQAELQSGVLRDAYGTIRYLPGIAKDR